jgi:hypothetical protein
VQNIACRYGLARRLRLFAAPHGHWKTATLAAGLPAAKAAAGSNRALAPTIRPRINVSWYATTHYSLLTKSRAFTSGPLAEVKRGIVRILDIVA